MNSLDTNILIYAVNRNCAEHEAALVVYEELLNEPEHWVLSDQVVFEFYRGLRSQKVLTEPLTHGEAMKQICFLRDESGVLNCHYKVGMWEELLVGLNKRQMKSSHVFDRILGVTLKNYGVKRFYTRNTKDFVEFDFPELVNPID